MIPLEKEIQIHKMLLAGSPHKEVSARMGVSASTVARISRAIRLADEVTTKSRRRARLLMLAGISDEAISARMLIQLDVVHAIRRSEFLMASVVESPHPCPTCGSVMLPPEDGEEHEFTIPPHTITRNHARRLFALADEAIGLAKAHTVRNMLFYDITDRMERLLASIIGEDYAEEESHY